MTPNLVLHCVKFATSLAKTSISLSNIFNSMQCEECKDRILASHLSGDKHQVLDDATQCKVWHSYFNPLRFHSMMPDLV